SPGSVLWSVTYLATGKCAATTTMPILGKSSEPREEKAPPAPSQMVARSASRRGLLGGGTHICLRHERDRGESSGGLGSQLQQLREQHATGRRCCHRASERRRARRARASQRPAHHASARAE